MAVSNNDSDKRLACLVQERNILIEDIYANSYYVIQNFLFYLCKIRELFSEMNSPFTLVDINY